MFVVGVHRMVGRTFGEKDFGGYIFKVEVWRRRYMTITFPLRDQHRKDLA